MLRVSKAIAVRLSQPKHSTAKQGSQHIKLNGDIAQAMRAMRARSTLLAGVPFIHALGSQVLVHSGHE
jgi:hypothetical protein